MENTAFTGVAPTTNGDPGCSVSAPVAETVNSDTLPLPATPPPLLIANRKFPTLSKVRNAGALFGATVVAKGVRAPALLIKKDVITRVLGLDVYRNEPLGEMASPISPVAFSETGNPDNGESIPVVGSREKPNTCAGVLLRAYTNFPLGWTCNRTTLLPDENGEPGTGVSAAVELLMLNEEMLAEAAFATKRNFFVGSIASESGEEAPVLVGDPEVFWSEPEVGSSK